MCLWLVALCAASALGAVGPPDVAEIGTAAEEVLDFDTGIDVEQVTSDDEDQDDPVEELGETDDAASQRDHRISAPVRDVSRQHAPKFVAHDERGIDLNTIMRKRVEPKPIVPKMSASAHPCRPPWPWRACTHAPSGRTPSSACPWCDLPCFRTPFQM